ncbi:hypothetical protein BKA56DRAFT_63381 [Ilyonectria sp. MPI-CAGE-AT-0026]|nr:hypothetical protein BKA56DRAFT_63381 [Ilyonectria sp. MPI-CAGE-AT-0026]
MSVWFRLGLFPITRSLDSMFLFSIYFPPSTTHGSWSGWKITQAQRDSKETANLRNTAQSSQILHPREFSSTPHISAHDERLMLMVDSRSSYWCWLRREFHLGNGTGPQGRSIYKQPNLQSAQPQVAGTANPGHKGHMKKKKTAISSMQMGATIPQQPAGKTAPARVQSHQKALGRVPLTPKRHTRAMDGQHPGRSSFSSTLDARRCDHLRP